MRTVNKKLSSHTVWFTKEVFDEVVKWNEDNPDMEINISGICREELKRVLDKNRFLKELYEKKSQKS